MIASLKGEIFSKEPGRVVLDVNGVGYEVFLSLTSYEQLPAVGCEVLLHVYTSVREDAIVLFGFGDAEEKEMFRLLTTVSGVGPRLALNILSGIKPAALVRAIATGDVKRLTGLPGVGKKTAARLCVDLKDKMALAADDDDFFVPETEERSAIGTLFADVVSGLVNLGYPPAQAQQAMAAVRKRLPAERLAAMRLEDLLRETLRSMV